MKRRKAGATIIATGIRKKRHTSPSVFKNNQKLILLTTVFICGVLLGILFVKYSSATTFTTLQNLMKAHFKQCESQSVWLNFLTTFSTEFLYIFAAVLFGFCIVGEPLLWILPLVKGLGVGAVSACLYKAYTLQGLEYYAAFLLIPSALYATVLLFSCKESILFSRDINRSIFKNTNILKGLTDVKLYLLRHFVLSLILLLGAVMYALLLQVLQGKITLFSA